ncbi:MAG TPA: ATP-binding cassette domain-containing protein [Myxococcota bacterium]|nr:ATP-binding cassette domain-containing protein [Myxococcota bacterium]HRY92771.1 ATP-binding cassette domain-containing protein [Myxococcota bacterium]HSA20434.1 ATP-binding cassette domain-containing protein [Myxococcota bacterium]
MSGPLLELQGLRVRRGARLALELSALQLQPGEALAVVGENGSGKSTLLLAVAGLLDLEAGEIRLAGGGAHCGRAPAPTAYRQALALALQEPYPFAGPALELATFGLRARGVGRRDARARARTALAELGIEGLAARQAPSLSGGERKLLSLAQLAALAPAPGLLLLDEPTAGVDEAHLAAVEGWVRAARGRGAGLMLATHDHALAARLADRTLELRAGRASTPAP